MFWFAKKVSNVKSAEDILKDLNACIDYTFVMPTVTNKQLEDACNTAYKQKYRSISVTALHVAYVRSYLQEKFGESPIKIIANIAFPLGEAAAEVKAYEAKRAMLDGADEIQMVLSISQAKSGAYDAIKNEIHRVVRMVKKCKVGVILETCYFNREEIAKLAKICLKCKVDSMITSTGYGTNGATEEDIALLSKIVEGRCDIVASGGIAVKADAVHCIRSGATRIATSREI